jgi:hypothetical protein
LLRLNIVGNISFVIRSSLEKSSASKMPRSPANDRDINRSTEYVQSRLINEAVYDWQAPIEWMLQSRYRRVEKVMIPDKHTVELFFGMMEPFIHRTPLAYHVVLKRMGNIVRIAEVEGLA